MSVAAVGNASCATHYTAAPATVTKVAVARAATGNTFPQVVTYKSPSCGGCESWVKHMRAAGFAVDVKSVEDMGGCEEGGRVPDSPGMEQAGVSQPYDVLLVARDGTTTVFAHHGS